MEALIASVKEFGILTPLLARKTEQERYHIQIEKSTKNSAPQKEVRRKIFVIFRLNYR